jgi:uncharacterized protein YfbU (UPF0304 family)
LKWNLTTNEKLILQNQYRILEKIDPENSDNYHLRRRIIQEELTLSDEDFYHYFFEELDPFESNGVLYFLDNFTEKSILKILEIGRV